MEKNINATDNLKLPELKKIYEIQVCYDNETWETLEESHDKEELSDRLKKLSDSRADQNGAHYRIIEK